MTLQANSMPAVQFTRLYPDVPQPTRAHPTDAGVDLVAYDIDESAGAPGRTAWVRGVWERSVIYPGGAVMIGTGIAAAIPAGYVGLLFARSSLGAKMRLDLANGAGVIDSEYRGEIKAMLRNTGSANQAVARGQRIAQLVVVPVNLTPWVEVENLDVTERGEGGFGSTGA